MLSLRNCLKHHSWVDTSHHLKYLGCAGVDPFIALPVPQVSAPIVCSTRSTGSMADSDVLPNEILSLIAWKNLGGEMKANVMNVTMDIITTKTKTNV